MGARRGSLRRRQAKPEPEYEQEHEDSNLTSKPSESQYLSRMARRSHRKSRTGCITYKTRKIKCDERRPECLQCEKHDVPCQYQSIEPSQSQPADSLHPSSTPPTQQQTLFQGDKYHAEAIRSDLDLRALELFHQFTSIVRGESFRSPGRECWQQQVVPLAFHHEFLMHGILALPAFHRAHLEPNRSNVFDELAFEHQNKALASYWPAMEKIDASNVEPLFAFALLLAPMSLCVPPSEKPQLGKITDFLFMCSGIRLLRQRLLKIDSNIKLAPLLHYPDLAGEGVVR